MSKKKHQHLKKDKIEDVVKIKQPLEDQEIQQSLWNKKSKLFLAIALFATMIAYSGSLFNGFIPNWDDGGYILENESIAKLDAKHLQTIWSEFYKGNYHPLTTTFYAVEYALVKDHSSFLYHLNNLILHLLNVFLVYFLILLLTKGRAEVAGITALFFGIHPMHVESVAWISERKDVLYTFFFLIALISYYFYAFKSRGEGKFLLYALVLFGLSMLSKSAAVVLPMVLILLDVYLKRKYELNRSQLRMSVIINIISFIVVLISFWLTVAHPDKDVSAKTTMTSMIIWYLTIAFSAGASVLSLVYYKHQDLKGNFIITNLIEKAGFFEMALVFGILAILSQGAAHAIQDLTPLFSFPERLMLASYATMTYIAKFFAPINLMAMYAYPDRISGHLPTIYLLAPLFIVGLVGFVILTRRKTKDILFGVLWFFITIILVLQLLPVGGAILSERYSYVPYIGLFFIFGKGYDWVVSNKDKLIKQWTPVLNTILIISALACIYLTIQRVNVWETGDKLFLDLAEKNPNLPFAHNNLGFYYYKYTKDYEKALYHYNKCIAIDPKFESALSNRGVLYFNMHKYQEALNDFTGALKLRQDKGDPWIGRANTYSTLQMFKEAIPDYNAYLKINPKDLAAYLWRGIAYFRTAKYDSSITDLNYFLRSNPKNDEAFYFRGFDYLNTKQYDLAIEDLTTSLNLNPKRTDIYNYIGFAKHYQKKYDEALEYYNKAIQLNPAMPEVYVNRSKTFYELKKYPQALADLETAGKMKYPLDRDYFLTLVRLTGKVM